MPTPLSTADLIDLVRKSGILPGDTLDRSLADVPELPSDPAKSAAVLVRRGVLTQFQAKLLLAGKFRGFRVGAYIIRDQLGLPWSDVGGGWLIFDAPEADIGCHPSDTTFHEISFYCDDIEATMAELKERGVTFTGPVTDRGFGLVTEFKLPDDSSVTLYQPKYEKGRR